MTERQWKDIPLAERREVNTVIESFGVKTTSNSGKSYREIYADGLKNGIFSDFDMATTPDNLRIYIARWEKEKTDHQEKWKRETAQRNAERNAQREALKQEKDAALEHTLRTGEPLPARFRIACGRCCECGKTLRDPESVRLGIGPECIKNVAKSLDVPVAMIKVWRA